MTETNPRELALRDMRRPESLREENFIKLLPEQIGAFDVRQPEEIVDLRIVLKNPTLVLKARTHYEEQFTAKLGDILVTSRKFISENRWK